MLKTNILVSNILKCYIFCFLFIQHTSKLYWCTSKMHWQPTIFTTSVIKTSSKLSLFSAWNIVNTFLTSHLDLNWWFSIQVSRRFFLKTCVKSFHSSAWNIPVAFRLTERKRQCPPLPARPGQFAFTHVNFLILSLCPLLCPTFHPTICLQLCFTNRIGMSPSQFPFTYCDHCLQCSSRNLHNFPIIFSEIYTKGTS